LSPSPLLQKPQNADGCVVSTRFSHITRKSFFTPKLFLFGRRIRPRRSADFFSHAPDARAGTAVQTTARYSGEEMPSRASRYAAM